MDEGIVIERAGPSDAAAILDLQKRAYRSEAELYDDFAIPPMTQTLPEMERDLETQVVLRAVQQGRLVGSVRAFEKDGSCHIGRLVVDPDRQNRGIGTQLMVSIEALFPNARRFELFTGGRSVRNLHLYARLGYRPYRTEPLAETDTMVFLEKGGAPRRSARAIGRD
jgi:GNAT superfamily N-acetyltransferase